MNCQKYDYCGHGSVTLDGSQSGADGEVWLEVNEAIFYGDCGKAVDHYLEENPIVEEDPTVPDWAKADTKPTYTPEEIGAVNASDCASNADFADVFV